MASHILSNVVFLKNLSPLVSEQALREFLRPALQQAGSGEDEIMNITFKQFPMSTQRYCQVDFKTSTGVTAATPLNGQTLLGVPLVITVIDPTSQPAVAPVPGMYGYGSAALPATASAMFAPPPSVMSAGLFPGATGDIQLAAMQAAALALQQPRTLSAPTMPFPLSGYPASSTPKETESQVIARTIQVDHVPDHWDITRVSDRLCNIARQIGQRDITVTDQKMIEELAQRVGLIEFKTIEMVERVKRIPEQLLVVEGNITMKLSTARATVTPRDPDNVSFEPPPSAPVPVAYQQLTKLKLAEKIARARALAEKFTSSASALTINDAAPLPTNSGSQVLDVRSNVPPRHRRYRSPSPRVSRPPNRRENRSGRSRSRSPYRCYRSDWRETDKQRERREGERRDERRDGDRRGGDRREGERREGERREGERREGERREGERREGERREGERREGERREGERRDEKREGEKIEPKDRYDDRSRRDDEKRDVQRRRMRSISSPRREDSLERKEEDSRKKKQRGESAETRKLRDEEQSRDEVPDTAESERKTMYADREEDKRHRKDENGSSHNEEDTKDVDARMKHLKEELRRTLRKPSSRSADA